VAQFLGSPYFPPNKKINIVDIICQLVWVVAQFFGSGHFPPNKKISIFDLAAQISQIPKNLSGNLPKFPRILLESANSDAKLDSRPGLGKIFEKRL
jgi:hypothetical protein